MAFLLRVSPSLPPRVREWGKLIDIWAVVTGGGQIMLIYCKNNTYKIFKIIHCIIICITLLFISFPVPLLSFLVVLSKAGFLISTSVLF